MIKTKEQEKAPETNLNEMGIMIINNVHQGQESNSWTNWDLNKNLDTINKYQMEIIELKNVITTKVQ